MNFTKRMEIVIIMCSILYFLGVIFILGFNKIGYYLLQLLFLLGQWDFFLENKLIQKMRGSNF